MSAALTWVGQMVQLIWGWFVGVVMAVAGWVIGLLEMLGVFLVEIAGFVLLLATSILPPIPDIPLPSAVPTLLAQANYFVPLSEAFTLLGIMGTLRGAAYLYKLAKFVRGGG